MVVSMLSVYLVSATRHLHFCRRMANEIPVPRIMPVTSTAYNNGMYGEYMALRVAGGSACYARSQGRMDWNDRQTLR